jgi:acetoin utilization deacetylase AcuC-like enzyme
MNNPGLAGGLAASVHRLSRAAGRWWRRLAGCRQRVDVLYSSSYRLDLSGLAQDPQRGRKILGFLDHEGLLDKRAVHRPREVSFRTLCRVHTLPYLESLAEAEVITRVTGLTLGERDRDRVVEIQRRMAGGTRLAVRLARDRGGIAFNLGGGMHHAFPDHGARFCLINDVAAAIVGERARGFEEPVLVVDLDLHDGDGTRAVFAADQTVHTFSIHNASSGTDPDAVASTSVELGSGIGDDVYLRVLREHLPPVVAAVRPRLVVYVAGSDLAAGDSIGDGELSEAAIFERDRFVTGLVRGAEGDVPLVVVLGGGYGRAAWRYSARYLAWLLAERAIEPPATEEVTLRRYRRIASLFRPAELTGDPATTEATDWGLSEDDVLGVLGSDAARRRFLGYYSPHGVELALERTGLFERLRRLGFSHPHVDFDLDHPAGETVRIFGDAAERELVIELRARRDGRTLAGFEMLRIEWLLLQNPHATFTAERPPLPGQRHPGLGMLDDVTALLVLICDRLGLDGLLFVPAHYHLAIQGRRVLRFLEPRDEARFAAMTEALGGLPVAEATRAVDDGRLIDATTGEPFELPAMPQVLPVSEKLRRHLEDPRREQRVEAERARHHYELRPAG